MAPAWRAAEPACGSRSRRWPAMSSMAGLQSTVVADSFSGGWSVELAGSSVQVNAVYASGASRGGGIWAARTRIRIWKGRVTGQCHSRCELRRLCLSESFGWPDRRKRHHRQRERLDAWWRRLHERCASRIAIHANTVVVRYVARHIVEVLFPVALCGLL